MMSSSSLDYNSSSSSSNYGPVPIGNPGNPGLESKWETQVILLTFANSLLFFIGICGNVWVISVIVYIFRTLRFGFAGRHMYIYVLSLCLVDTMVMLCLPMAAITAIKDAWIFGPVLCRLYLGFEGINKILSTFILTGLSFDRYVAICHPVRTNLRTTKVAVLFVACSAVSAFLLLSPLYIYVEVRPMRLSNDSDSTEQTERCSNNFSSFVQDAFFTYIFITGFCLPAVLMSFFYMRILLRICGHTKSAVVQTQISVRKVTLFTLMVVGFYFCCWTPYWLAMLYVLTAAPESVSMIVINMLQWIHILPYANSALNWIFYALLNRQLRQTHEAAQEQNRLIHVGRVAATLEATNSTGSINRRESKPVAVANGKPANRRETFLRRISAPVVVGKGGQSFVPERKISEAEDVNAIVAALLSSSGTPV